MFADASRDPPVRFVPVVGWAVVETGASAGGDPPSVAALASRARTPRGPEVVPIAEGDDAPVLPGTPGYLGALGPGEPADGWVERARAILARRDG